MCNPHQKVEDATQEASSNAVAQLQAGQQDPSIPMRVSSSTEMLTAQDVLSFEMLKITDNNQAESEMETEVATLTHQTTPTPHNTPLGSEIHVQLEPGRFLITGIREATGV